MTLSSAGKKYQKVALISAATIVSLGALISSLATSPPLATALSITSITANKGPISGGTEVTIAGDFNIQGASIIQISARNSTTCALASNNRIYCWGENWSGAVGNGSGGYGVEVTVPVAVDNSGVLKGKTIAQISASSSHSCALDSGGKAYCWGSNWYGELGDGNFDMESFIPVAVDTSGALSGKTLIQIVAGSFYTCAIDSSGQVYCWGSNSAGQLGDGLGGSYTDISPTPTPVDTSGVLAGKTLTQVAAGLNHACALSSTGQAYCWGSNWDGQLGDGTTTHGYLPVAVDTSGILNGKTLTQIDANHNYTCALDSAGKAYCWGFNWLGSLGDGSTTDSSVPVPVDTSGALSGKTLTQIATGSYTTCVLDTSGLAYCWGHNYYGQLGNNSTTDSLVPVPIYTSGHLSGKTLTQLANGGSYVCALDSAGQAYCWGVNQLGQLGNGEQGYYDDVPAPAPVHTVSFGTGSELPDLHDLPLTVIFDVGGTPAECINIVIAPDHKTLTCTTTAHPAGLVSVTVNTLTSSTLADAFEYFTLIPPNTGAKNH